MDVDKLASSLEGTLSPAICKVHPALCSPAGLRFITEAIDDKHLSGCLVAGCGAGVKDEVFRLPEDVYTERVDIRELVAWSMDSGTEDTMMAADDYIRMGFAGMKHASVPKPFLLKEVSESILVVGAGVTGLQAALEGADAGYSVHIVEKKDVTGGWAATWKKQIPFDQPFSELRDPVVRSLVKRANEHKKITIHLETTIERIDGQPGEFRVKLNGGGEELTVGSIVFAAGWKPYEPSKPLFGLGEVPGVITSVELEEKVNSGSLEKVSSVLFIQCAGSRDKEHLPYCSSVCCGVSLKQARYIRDLYPDAIIYIVYKDIRTTGFMEEFYREMQDDPHMIFIKGDVQQVKASEQGINISVKDSLLGEELEISADKVVLATGMVPNVSTDLKLGYRLGQGIPQLKYAFSDSHFICFPYESRRTGIYPAGAVRAPQDIPSAMDDGAGAMMKAIQMIESVKRGDAVHPRAGDRSFPELYLERCTDCKRCTEECPFGTYDETPSGTPVVNPNRCRRCGICLGACPERVISFADFSITSVSEKIKAVGVPDEFEEKPRVLAFVCENDALPALRMAVRNGLKINPYLRVIPVRCLGSVNRVWVTDALSRGFDGVLQLGCKPGDDYQCHFIHGSELNEQRSDIYEETLSSMMLEPERIATRFVEITEYQAIIKHIDDYMDEVDLMGPNPFKDM